MKIHPLSVIVPLAAALIAVVVLALDTGAAQDCSDAKESGASGLVHQAQKSYAALLADEPASDCALEGMQATLVELCHRADALRGGGADEEARKAYVAVLDADPDGDGHRCARLGLREPKDPATTGSGGD